MTTPADTGLVSDAPSGSTLEVEPRRPNDHDLRMERARLALDGLALGDAFGERFFRPPDEALWLIRGRALPRAPWAWTDDTAMAISIVEVLEERARIDGDVLARRFAARYADEPDRGYGGGAISILHAICLGVPWSIAAGEVFDGQGSMGNGGGMRSSPIGAYWADDPATIVVEATASARVTHAHPEGIAGAIAIALAAGWAARSAVGGAGDEGLLEHVLRLTPASRTRQRIAAAAALTETTEVLAAAAALGSGQRVLSEDTVPFAIWSAARHLDDFEAAMWATVEALGDRDTTCAMVGGIVALRCGRGGLPDAWMRAREPLPASVRATP